MHLSSKIGEKRKERYDALLPHAKHVFSVFVAIVPRGGEEDLSNASYFDSVELGSAPLHNPTSLFFFFPLLF
jgi:hypothetical protein